MIKIYKRALKIPLLNFRSLYRFSEDPQKGFEKFKRTKKVVKQNQDSSNKEKEQKDEKMSIKQEDEKMNIKQEDEKKDEFTKQEQDKFEYQNKKEKDSKKNNGFQNVLDEMKNQLNEYKKGNKDNEKNKEKNKEKYEFEQQKNQQQFDNLNQKLNDFKNKKRRQNSYNVDDLNNHFSVMSQLFSEYYKNFKFQKQYYYILALLLGYASIKINEKLSTTDQISYQEFLYDYLYKNKIQSITIQQQKNQDEKLLLIETSDGQKKLVIKNFDSILKIINQEQLDINIYYQQKESSEKYIDTTFTTAQLLLFCGSIAIIMRTLVKYRNKAESGGSNIFNMGKTKAKQFSSENINIKFKDVAGLDEAKVEIQEFVDFLQKPGKYIKLGAKIPKGALLTGPPGTGKTLMAKACAGEAGVPYFYVSGSEFVEMFVGTGASRVRDLFKQAREKAPCMIFIDEIDAIGRKRDNKMGGNDERDSTLNQLLVEMDGFDTQQNVIIFAATNRKELLDPALQRPGRFDRSIDITLPDLEGRRQIFLVHLKPIQLDSSLSIETCAKRLSTLTPGFSGADIANLCNEAAILAARSNKDNVTVQDFESAAERVMAGLERSTLVDKIEQKTVAIHESGHAVVSWFLEGCNPLVKLTIIPRSKGSLGYAQYLPNEGSLQTKQELLDQICGVLAGRCAELEFQKSVTTGAQNDLQKAAQIATSIVTKLGMSENIGYTAFKEEQMIVHSQDQQYKIDLEIKNIIDQQTERCKMLIIKHKQDIINLSQALLEKQTLDLNEIIDILGQRPFQLKSQFKEFLQTKQQIKMDNEN